VWVRRKGNLRDESITNGVTLTGSSYVEGERSTHFESSIGLMPFMSKGQRSVALLEARKERD